MVVYGSKSHIHVKYECIETLHEAKNMVQTDHSWGWIETNLYHDSASHPSSTY